MTNQILRRLLPFISVFFIFAAAPASLSAKEIYYVKVEGIVNPVMAEFVVSSLKKATVENAEAFIIQLDTPGGLDYSMRDIVKAILSSEVPVVVYVAPSGSRAASAGVFITYAANVAAMAPGTNIGSAHPVAMYGEKMDPTMAKKVENDSVAYIMSIAGKRKRDAGWAEKAVRESANITADEALKLNVINLIAENRKELLEKLDGFEVETLTGQRAIRTKGAAVKDVEMNLRFRVLDIISNPNVAYILMMIGLIGLYFELSNPGVILPGVIGVVSLVLAFYAFQTLPVNYAGLLLVGLGLIFFVLEIKIASYGLLTVAGMVSLILGSLMLFSSPLPFMRLSIWVMLPTVVFMTVFILGTMYYALRIHRKRPVSGAEGLIGRECTAVEDINGGGGGGQPEGRVFIEGEYWNATSGEPVKKGDTVRVVEVKGLLLKVAKK